MNLLLETRRNSPGGLICFREFAPVTALRAHVACFWTFAASAPRQEPYRHRVLPDGCTDIIFNLQAASPAAVVIGPMAAAREVISHGTLDLGVRFYPGSAPIFLGHPLAGLQERVIPLAEFWGLSADRLLDEMLGASSFSRRIAIIENRLHARLRRPAIADRHLVQAIKWTYAERGRLNVRQLSQAVGICERQLRRKFPAWTGYTPKQFVRLMRFQHALETLAHRPGLGDAVVAAQHGYSDQAHMIHEFQEFGGGTPGEFRRARRSPADECPIFSIPTPGTLRYDLVP